MANRIHVRCMWFDDEKEPVAGGCKRRGACEFIHPNDREWARAPRKQLATQRPRHHERAPTPPTLRSRREEMSKPKQSSNSFNSRRHDDRGKETSDFDESSWNVASSSSKGKAPERTSAWSSSGWGSPPKGSANSGTGTSASSDKKDDWGSASGWGVSSGWADGTSIEWGAGSGWNAGDSSGDKDKGTGGWGTSDTSTGGGWGSADAGSGSGGWGSGSGWGDPAGWEPIPASAAGSSTPETSKVAEARGKTASRDIPTKKPSLTIHFGHSRQSSTDDSLPTPDARKTVSFAIPAVPTARMLTESKGKERAMEPPELSIDTQTTVRTREAQPSSAGGSRDSRRTGGSSSNSNTLAMRPPAVPGASSRIPPTPSSTTSTGSTSKELLGQAKAIKRRIAMVPENMKPKISILQVNLNAEERAEVYRKTIMYIQDLVCIQVKLNKMKTTEQNWKRSQASDFYANSSQLAREKLTAGRNGVAEGLAELRRQRETVIKELVTLPDIPTKPYRPYNVMVDRQKLIDYTSELKTWMEELDIPKRVRALQIKEVQTPDSEKQSAKPSSSAAPDLAEATSDAMAVDHPEVETKPGIVEQLRALPRVTIADINNAIEALQNSVALAWDKVSFEAYTQEEIDSAVDDIRREVTEMLKARKLRALKTQKLKLRVAMDEQEKAKDELSGALDQKLILGEAVNERINSVQSNIDELKRKTAELNRINDELEPLIIAAEQRQQNKTAYIDNMTNQIQALMARRARPKQRKVREYTIDDIPLEFRQTIVNEVVAEVQPVLEGMLAGTSQVGEELKAVLEQMIEPLLEKTETITKAVKSIPAAS